MAIMASCGAVLIPSKAIMTTSLFPSRCPDIRYVPRLEIADRNCCDRFGPDLHTPLCHFLPAELSVAMHFRLLRVVHMEVPATVELPDL